MMRDRDMMNNCEDEHLDKHELMKRIQEIGFYAVDLNLYIDNFPEDQQAVKDYKAISNALNNLKRVYENYYGPLKNFGDSEFPGEWNYVNEPWPWEN
ncbi:spore coat protein JB [Clostridium amylolyticum]|uniref:Spore coat protein JB n=1 Tax=Clostridium amylolyticum TaxID=1121298 RepID=A0A1M6MBY2_9CLOT|nr:spore coat protein CotJB [Clostridium amylolyticum]SHJ80870.1 spore coat protein JB [Clostridium amylolyticum]